ncbi:hypothetical protein X777_13725 [Ooceraea biroi]|uniref:Uncharacterized protein n=1 Tax=Ooceraea biroi TaxID=2015173 RepID=A0A026WYF8_OOCBI|nr:hypothetical protein X777_13725 [Ooceraea biroi]
MVKAICKFNIHTIPTTKVLIAGQMYKFINAIFHSGMVGFKVQVNNFEKVLEQILEENKCSDIW